MKILFVVSDANCNGGTEILAYNLIHELNRNGLECKLLSRWVYTGDDPNVISLPADTAARYCKIAHNPIDKFCGHQFSDSFIKKEIEKIVVEGHYDWIVNHTYDLCAAIPQIDGIKTAQVFNWSIPGYEKVLLGNISAKGALRSFVPLLAFKVLRNRWHKSLGEFTKLVMLTDSAHQEIRDVDGTIASDRVVTIPNPLMQTRTSENVTNLQHKNVVFVGRLSHEKGVMRLLRIWERIHKQLSDYTLSIYGKGDVEEEMHSWLEARGEGLEKSVKFMGFCNDLTEIYTHADLLLMTSDSEGFGMVLIEAMYYGVPCIAFNCPISPKEIIADAGIVVSCFDEEYYADEVLKLLCEHERMKVLQKRAVERAKDYYIDKVIALWMAMFNQK